MEPNRMVDPVQERQHEVSVAYSPTHATKILWSTDNGGFPEGETYILVPIVLNKQLSTPYHNAKMQEKTSKPHIDDTDENTSDSQNPDVQQQRIFSEQDPNRFKILHEYVQMEELHTTKRSKSLNLKEEAQEINRPRFYSERESNHGEKIHEMPSKSSISTSTTSASYPLLSNHNHQESDNTKNTMTKFFESHKCSFCIFGTFLVAILLICAIIIFIDLKLSTDSTYNTMSENVKNIKNITDELSVKHTKASVLRNFPTIKKIQCKAIEDHNGKINCKNNYCNITCNKGFIVDGHKEAKCKHRKWNHQLNCKKQTCEKPIAPKHARTLECQNDKYFYQDTCTVKCIYGRKNDSKESILCNHIGKWENIVKCKPPPPTAFCAKDELQKSEYGRIDCPGKYVCGSNDPECKTKMFEPGTNCFLLCNNDEVSLPVYCQEDGKWNQNLDEKSCTETCKNIDLLNGYTNITQHSISSNGIRKGTGLEYFCNAGYIMKRDGEPIQQPITTVCNNRGKWSKNLFGLKCEDNKVILIGGESNGNEVSTVEIIPSCKQEIPNIPQKLTWGSSGLVDGHIVFCGGQSGNHISNICYTLKNNTWIKTMSLTSGRSKSSYASMDGSLTIFSGYSAYYDKKINGWSLPTVEEISSDGKTWTSTLINEDSIHPTYQSSATPLPDGRIVITGGNRKEQKAMIFNPIAKPSNAWSKLPDLNEERIGHASTFLMLKKSENVIIAGGWNKMRGFLNSMEMFDVNRGIEWIQMKELLPEGRTDFTLVILSGSLTALGGYYVDEVGLRKYPPVYQIELFQGSFGSWHKAPNISMTIPRSGFSATSVPLSNLDLVNY